MVHLSAKLNFNERDDFTLVWFCVSGTLNLIIVMLTTGEEALGGCSGTGEGLDSFNLESLVEVHIHGLRSFGDLQVLHATFEGSAGRDSSLTNSI